MEAVQAWMFNSNGRNAYQQVLQSVYGNHIVKWLLHIAAVADGNDFICSWEMPGFCMQLMKAYVAKTYCNELLLIDSAMYMLITLCQ